MYSIIELTKQVGWRYYVIAATKEAKPRTRVIDMSGIVNDFALREDVEQALNDIEAYENGTKRPVLLNDKSRMKGDFQVRFCEKFEVRFRLLTLLRGGKFY